MPLFSSFPVFPVSLRLGVFSFSYWISFFGWTVEHCWNQQRNSLQQAFPQAFEKRVFEKQAFEKQAVEEQAFEKQAFQKRVVTQC